MFLFLIIAPFVILLATVCIYNLTKYEKKIETFFKKIPGPPPIFLFGNTWELKSPSELFDATIKYCAEYGKTYKLHLPFQKLLVTADPKLIELVANSSKTTRKSTLYEWVEAWLERGLLTSHGSAWKLHRKIIAPSFNTDILREFVNSFEHHGDVLVKKWQNYLNLPYFDVCPLIKLCTLDVICDTTMGVNIRAQEDVITEFSQSFNVMGRIIFDRLFSPLKRFKSTFKLTLDYYRQTNCLKILHSYSRNIIKERSNKLKISSNFEINCDEKNNKKRAKNKHTSLLDTLLLNSNGGKLITYEEIRAEVDTFLLAGHDTITSGFGFTLYCLANHPEVQRKAYLEQRELLGCEQNPEITYSDLENMKYLDMVIKETMRLYPPAPLIGRHVDEDFVYGDKVIPKGIDIVILLHVVHRLEEYFPNALKFDPDRFLTASKFVPSSYIPFSTGPRNCIGQKFGMLELKSLVSKVLRHFEVLPSEPEHIVQLECHISLKSANGIRIRLQKRDKNYV